MLRLESSGVVQCGDAGKHLAFQELEAGCNLHCCLLRHGFLPPPFHMRRRYLFQFPGRNHEAEAATMHQSWAPYVLGSGSGSSTGTAEWLLKARAAAALSLSSSMGYAVKFGLAAAQRDGRLSVAPVLDEARPKKSNPT